MSNRGAGGAGGAGGGGGGGGEGEEEDGEGEGEEEAEEGAGGGAGPPSPVPKVRRWRAQEGREEWGCGETVLPILQALRRGSRLGTGRGIGSLSPIRTSATSSSMSSLSPGRRSRWLGTQVSGGSRTLTSPARKLSAAMSNTVAVSVPPDSWERGSDRGLRQRLHRRP